MERKHNTFYLMKTGSLEMKISLQMLYINFLEQQKKQVVFWNLAERNLLTEFIFIEMKALLSLDISCASKTLEASFQCFWSFCFNIKLNELNTNRRNPCNRKGITNYWRSQFKKLVLNAVFLLLNERKLSWYTDTR